MALEALAIATAGQAGRAQWLDEKNIVYSSGNGFIAQHVETGAQVGYLVQQHGCMFSD